MKHELTSIGGACHCGNVEFEFKTVHTPETLVIRNCQCSFCLMHGAATARDPDGQATIKARDPNLITLYRFGTNSSDFIICGVCGVYAGAVVTHGQRKYVTLNMRLTNLDTGSAEPIEHPDETPDSRIANRVERFTPLLSYPRPLI